MKIYYIKYYYPNLIMDDYRIVKHGPETPIPNQIPTKEYSCGFSIGHREEQGELHSDFHFDDTLYFFKEALNRLKMPLIGQHHSGEDDAYNIARILQRMTKDHA